MVHYLSYRAVLKKRFGAPVIRVPLNGGFSCPNRDGKLDTKGCLFCDNRSFSPAALENMESAASQLLRRYPGGTDAKRPLVPYLQPFTNTYGPVDKLRRVYEPLLSVAGVVGLAVGTRPDCFSEEIYRYLADLAKRTFLTIELGLQSSHDVTLARCNRRHTFRDFEEAVKRLAECSVETVAHVMLGLPGENREMMMQTADRIARLPCSGVKIHQLMIIKDTPFAREYAEGAISVLTLENYTKLLCEFLSRLRPDQHIHRIMADSTEKNGLVAPEWSADKSGSISFIRSFMDAHNTKQGSNLRP